MCEKQWDGAVASSKAASQELCSLQASLGEDNYQSFCPRKELKLSMPWQPLLAISAGGFGPANSQSVHLWRGPDVGSPLPKLKLSSIYVTPSFPTLCVLSQRKK